MEKEESGIFTTAQFFSDLSLSPHTATDDELIAAYRQKKDNRFLGVLLERYTLLLLGVCLKYLKDKDAAQDAVQSVFLKVITNLPEGAIQNFKGWLYVTARNHCLQLLRDKKYFAGDEALEVVVAHDDGVKTALDKEMTMLQLEVALKDLAQPQQYCIREFYLNQKSYQDIMEETGFSFAQVKSYIQNGKRNLRLSVLQKLKGQP